MPRFLFVFEGSDEIKFRFCLGFLSSFYFIAALKNKMRIEQREIFICIIERWIFSILT